MRGACSLLVVLALAAAACSSGDDSDSVASGGTDGNTGTAVAPDEPVGSESETTTPDPATTAGPTTTPATSTTTPTGGTDVPTSEADVEPELGPADADTVAAIEGVLAAQPVGCDPLDARQCLLPFPSDATSVVDPDTITGRRVAFPIEGMAVNAAGMPIDPAEWNRSDGFSANTPILTFVDDLDPVASELPTWTDLGASLDEDATVVLVDQGTGERIPLWAEPDVKAEDPSERLLVIHPAISLAPATTYVVALRGLVTTSGAPVEPSPVFEVYRDRLTTGLPEIDDRRSDLDAAFDALGEAGVDRADLQLAWTFTTASTSDVTGRMLHIRDETLAQLGDDAPPFTITTVTEQPEEGLARLVEGTFTTTNWLTGSGGPGEGFNDGNTGDDGGSADPDGLPVANGTLVADFACVVADSTMNGSVPGRLSQYGHGLLGSHLEIDAGNVVAMSNEHNVVTCATKWAGMSDVDIPNAVASLEDLTNFSTVTDRLQQGVLNQLVLSRLMLSDDGLVADPNFLRPDGTPLIDTSALYYDGNSQGGIMGIMFAAVSTDIERAVLGVVGMNYSVLLPRSVDFDTYESIFIPAYPSALDRAILLGQIQMLWDRAEGAGYIRHLVSDPLPGTPAKDVLMHVALGDWQVSELTAMIAARTAGIPIHRPVTAPGRSAEVDAGWGIDTLDVATDSSALVIWDSGSDLIPIEQVAPRTSRDPHGDPRNDVDVRTQKAAFLFDGVLVDVCGGEACTADAR